MPEEEPVKIPNNYQLSRMMLKMDGKLDQLVEAKNDTKKWQEEHVKNDKKEFDRLDKRISTMSKFYNSIAVVAGGLGVAGGVTIAWLKKQV